MQEKGTSGTVGGWQAPCDTFDYEQLAREAQGECEKLKKRMDALKARRERDADAELLRRREICLLTDIYYEQRHQARLFRQRAEERRTGACRLPVTCQFRPNMIQ